MKHLIQKTLLIAVLSTFATFLVEAQNKPLAKEYGFINKKGKVIIPMKYAYAGEFYEGRAVIKVGKKYGFIDKKGREII